MNNKKEYDDGDDTQPIITKKYNDRYEEVSKAWEQIEEKIKQIYNKPQTKEETRQILQELIDNQFGENNILVKTTDDPNIYKVSIIATSIIKIEIDTEE